MDYLTPAQAGTKVGDYFVASWGYDQTNVNFFKVVALGPKTVKVQEWSSRVDHSDYHDYMVPGDGPKTWRHRDYDYDTGVYGDEIVTIAPIETKRLKTYDGKTPSLAWASYADLRPWDGTPAYQTNAYAGH